MIRFKSEYELNGSINFLDTILTGNTVDNTITVQWFRKETASDRLLNFKSWPQVSFKHNLVNNMARRVISATTAHSANYPTHRRKKRTNSSSPCRYPTILELKLWKDD